MSTADNNDIEAATVHGNDVDQITAHGDIVFQSGIIVDNFEHNDPESYYEPIDTAIDTTADAAYRGNYGLSAPNDDISAAWSIPNEIQNSGQNARLDGYPQRGDTFSVWFNLREWSSTDARSWISFGDQWHGSTDDQIRIALNPDGDDIDVRLREPLESGTSLLDSALWTTHSLDVWYEYNVEWAADGAVTVDLNESDGSNILTVGPATPDAEVQGGGIMFRTNTAAVDYDEFIIDDRGDETGYGSWFFAEPSDNTGTTSEFQGVVFEPTTDFSGIDVWIDWQASDFTRGLLYEYDADAETTTIVENEDISSLSGGDTFTISHAFDSSIDYLLGLDADGADYTRARGPFDRPTHSDDFSITDGVYNDSPDMPTEEYRYNIRTIRVVE